MPWAVVSMFLKALVHDAHPDHIPSWYNTGTLKESNRFCLKDSTILETTKNIEHTYRDNSVFERKP